MKSYIEEEPSLKKFLLVSAIALLSGCATNHSGNGNTASTAVDGYDFGLSAEELTALCSLTLETAEEKFTAIEIDTRPASLDIVYGDYDAMNVGLQDIQYVWYVSAVHPDPEVQTAAEGCIASYMDFATSIELSPQFYQRVAAIDLETLSASERLMIERRLRDFRKAGVDRDEETRDKVREIIAEITAIGTEFDKNIRTGGRSLSVSPDELRGLPEDYLSAHPADENGQISISTDYPDLFPVLTYAENDDLRRRLYIESKSIATPANDTTLKNLIEKRHELATLLGYPNHAALAIDGSMMGTPEAAQVFLARVGGAAKDPASREMAILLKRLRQIDPQAETVEVWQSSYLSNLVKQEDYAIDAREVRQYFHFERVQSGIFAMTENMFGVEIVPWKTNTWHEDVSAWEVRENGIPIGRFYLDMHPRENKYKHAAHWTLRTGLKDGDVPMSGMVMNFPRGLMEHTQVETFLHEFGHLLHNMFSGTQEWLDISGMSMERDFVEAPSQMLEEWVWDYDTLRTFAINNDGEVIPETLVKKMVRARDFGEAAGTAQQIFYSNLSLNYYNRDPDSFELLALMEELQAEYSPYPYIPGTNFYNNFNHLNGYSSNYYIYQWSKAISTALLSRFQQEGLSNTSVAREYRKKILSAGGSKPAEQLVEDFLGEEFSADAYINYLQQLN
jgi:thimet oligopeptidase